MTISPGDIIESIIDDLAMGEIGQQTDSLTITRIDAANLLLDFGDSGRFVLTVTADERHAV